MVITAPARAISVGLVAIITLPIFAQTPSTSARFDVASVKATDPKAAAFPLLRPRPGQLTATGMPLRTLVQHAYGVEEFQVVATEGWQSSERFEVVGKAADPRATLEDMLPMPAPNPRRHDAASPRLASTAPLAFAGLGSRLRS